MMEKELRKLSRADLLEMLIEQGKLVQKLQRKLAYLEEQAEQRELVMTEAGSIAEASLKLNGVFEAAEAAGQQYLDSIKNLSQRQEEICRRMEQECQARIDKRLAETEEKCAAMEAWTKARCVEMLKKAKEGN